MDNNPTNTSLRKLLVGAATLAAATPLLGARLVAWQGSGEQQTKAGASGATGVANPGANATLTRRV